MRKTAGRPRSGAADKAILQAATKLFLKQSFNDVSMEGIAAAAAVSKATLYRRWPNKYFLAVAVLMHAIEPAKISFDGQDYQQHLVRNLKALRNMLASDYADMIMAVIAQSQQDDQLREEFFQSFLRPVQAIGDADLAQAIATGQVRAETNQDLLFDQMFGFFFYRLLVAHREISDADIETIAASFMQVAKV